jgi:hypothetical protein
VAGNARLVVGIIRNIGKVARLLPLLRWHFMAGEASAAVFLSGV